MASFWDTPVGIRTLILILIVAIVLPLLLAVEVIPDIFRTLGNVTADVGVTAVLDRHDPTEEVAAPELI